MKGKQLSKNLEKAILILAVACLMLSLLPITGTASTRWTTDGTPVCTVADIQRNVHLTTDGCGGSIQVWQDLRSGQYDIYAQRISADGTPLWTTNGVAICTAGGNQRNPRAVHDENGGAIIAWRDSRSGTSNIYAQRVDSNGNTLWTANGVAVCTIANGANIVDLVPDGAGGAIIIWDDFRVGPNVDIYAQRLDPSGTALWTSNGVGVCTHGDQQFGPVITADGLGGAVIAWDDYRSGPNSDVYAQRLDPSGTALWTANGVGVCTQANPQLNSVLTADGSGGAVIAWEDFRSGNWNVYAQRLDASGTALWTPNGVGVCTEVSDQFEPSITPDGKSGVLISWEDARSGNWDIYAQRVDSSGDPQWEANGIAVCTAASNQLHLEMTADGTGGAIIAWEDYRSGSHDIYAQRINSLGSSQWTADGIPVCTAAADQASLWITPDGTSGGIISWRDYRSDNGDIYTQKVSDYGETWYLAEGTTAWGFSTYITIENPNSAAVTANITYMTETGAVSGGNLTLPPRSQTTVNPETVVPNRDFSTKIVSTGGRTISVDRTMMWTGAGAPSTEGHCCVGVTSPAEIWYLPEGSSEWGFECWLLIQNPNSVAANCRVTYMIEGAAPQVFMKTVPPNSRRTYSMAEDIGARDASIKVEANVPVIPERAMYRNNRREGHDSIGTTKPARDYYLAEGTSAWGFTTYVLIQNPNNSNVDVTVTYMTESGPVPQPTFNMPPNSRKTIRVNDFLPNTDFSTRVRGSKPIIAERAMYWGEGTSLGEACHDSIGLPHPYRRFFLPDGQTTGGFETWTLVQNPNPVPVQVEIAYLTPTGTGNVSITDTLPANSRRTYNMADAGISGRASVRVTCQTPNRLIMVERAMYWNNRGGGTDTIGSYSY